MTAWSITAIDHNTWILPITDGNTKSNSVSVAVEEHLFTFGDLNQSE